MMKHGSKFLLALLIVSSAMAGGIVEGRVVDPSRYAVSNATVQFLLGGAGEAKYRAETSSLGVYRIDDVAPGDYVIRVNHPAFSEGSIRITVTDHSRMKAGTIVLPLLPCDAPGVICDSVEAVPVPLVVRGARELQVGCAVDLDTGTPSCEPSPTTDLKFVAGEDGKRYLELLNGAKLCEGADQRLRVDGLRGGDSWCIVTNANHRSQVYINLKVVETGSASIGLLFMTR